MADYLTQKIKPVDTVAERLQKEMDYNEKLKKLKASSAEVVPDFQAPLVKDLPVEKIKTNVSTPVTSISEFQARNAVRNAEKEAKMAALGKIGDTIDYSKFKNFGKTVGKKVLGAAGMIPGAGMGIAALGGVASALASQDASAGVPLLESADSVGPAQGSFDQRLEQGLLTPEEKAQMEQEQLRIKALQGLING
jgi:hypothetical protein